MNEPKAMSGADFRLRFLKLAQEIKDDDRVFFGVGDLSFHTFKDRGPVEGPRLVQVVFNETYKVDQDDALS